MFQGLEHIALATPDPEKLAQWYVDHLEFHVNYRYGKNVFVKAPNGTVLEMIPSEGNRAEQTMKTPGIRHLAVLVDDFDSAYDHLKAKGIEFVTDKIEVQGNRMAFFEDMEGNLLHLVYRVKPLP